LFLDVIKFIREERVEDDEISQGKFVVPYEISYSGSSANISDMKYLDWDIGHLIFDRATFSASYDEDKKKTFSSAAQITAIAPYAVRPMSTAQYTWNGSTIKLYERVQNASVVLSNYEWWSRYVTFALPIAQNQMQRAAKGVLQNGLVAKVTWDIQNVLFQKRRTRIGRQVNEAKIKFATIKGGSLNFVERMLGAGERFDADFTDALDRFNSLRKGMLAIYDLESDPPDIIESIMSGKAVSFSESPKLDEPPLDAYVAYVRTAIARVLRIIDADQQFTIGRSIRNSISEDQWNFGLANGGVRTISIGQQDTSLSDICLPRVRGISVFSEWQSTSDVLEVSLIPPRESFTRRGAGQWRSLDQSHLPPCKVGNVGRESNRPPSTAGTQVLFNCSPIGNWQLKVLSVRNRTPLDQLKDIVIEWQLAGQSSTTA
jgi:hypothetical protein